MKIQESRIREINSLHAELESLAKTGMAKAKNARDDVRRNPQTASRHSLSKKNG